MNLVMIQPAIGQIEARLTLPWISLYSRRHKEHSIQQRFIAKRRDINSANTVLSRKSVEEVQVAGYPACGVIAIVILDGPAVEFDAE
jgi:hypothetical protein